MTQVTVNGHPYSDDGSAARDMLNGGAKTWFLPLVSDVMSEAGAAAASAVSADDSADRAEAASAALSGTSSSSVIVGGGPKNFATQANKQFPVGTFLLARRAADASVYMIGQSAAYNPTTGALTIDATHQNGAGTFADWVIVVTGKPGATGATGVLQLGARTIASADALIVSDSAKLITLDGTFTLGASACAILGDKWFVFVRATTAGVITFDPAGSETIDGALTTTFQRGESRLIQCDGTRLQSILLEAGASGLLHLQDRRASGINGSGLAGGVNSVRVINTTVSNTIPGASLSANQVALPAGVYDADIDVPCGLAATDVHRASLYNATDATTLILGTNANATNGVASKIRGRFTLTASKLLEVRDYHTNSNASGLSVSDGQGEVYLNMVIEVIA